MQIAVLTFDGLNEPDSFVAVSSNAAIFDRVIVLIGLRLK